MTLPYRFLLYSTLLAAAILLAAGATTRALPSPTPAQPAPLTIYAIWEGINDPTTDETLIRAQMDKLLDEFGPGNRWHHPGFAFIYGNYEHTALIAKIVKEKGVSIGVIFAVQAHTRSNGDHNFLDHDLRSYQWRMNTPHWEGFFTGQKTNGGLEIPSDGRDAQVPSPSRYSPLGRQLFSAETLRQAAEVRHVMNQYPGVITCIKGVIEEELACASASAKQYPEAADYLGDYSPFAVTEFRDWLLHRGAYDDTTGKYPSQGAPEAITGPFVTTDGHPRSPFYRDPDPATHTGPGQSFNQRFGTHFKTWSLRYWDTNRFPDPITDRTFSPMPTPGEKGCTDGGFDAPRTRDASAWWRAWSWDYHDRGDQYPPGNPATPAFGFRQCEVAHFVQDRFDDMAAAGLPRDIMYAHQIPDEQVDQDRCRSGASLVWTGYLPKSATVGITCFGWFDPALALQYCNLTPDNHGWGIFEWHPRPNSTRDAQQLYDSAMKELLVYSRENCRHLFAGWWDVKGRDADPKQIFWLTDSKFAEAIKTFMASTPDNPPPMPTGVFSDKKIR
jgi:hypothetical protein